MSHTLTARLAIVATLFCLCLPAAALAHDEAVSTSEVQITGRTLTWKVDVGIAGLAKVVALPAGEATLDDRGLQSARTAVCRYLAGGLVVSLDGRTSPMRCGSLEPRYEPAASSGPPVLARAVQTLQVEADAPISLVKAKVAFFSDLTSQHRALIKVRWGQQFQQFVRLGPAELVLLAQSESGSAWQQAREFFPWGVRHIFGGYDHIAFVLALLVAVTRLRALLAIVTSFTIAHSATLLLSALGWLTIPSRITEALIALSIVYVAAENLTFGEKTARFRWLITFSFGLVHGLGFATELSQRLAERPGRVILPVVSFNLGVEAGQLLIVTALWPLLSQLRRAATEKESRRKQRRLLVAGSVPILLFGLVLLLTRL